jgi:hypothetical protein
MAIAVLSVAVSVTVIVLVFVATYLGAADEDKADDGKGTRERHTDDALRGRGIGRGVPDAALGDEVLPAGVGEPWNELLARQKARAKRPRAHRF